MERMTSLNFGNARIYYAASATLRHPDISVHRLAMAEISLALPLMWATHACRAVVEAKSPAPVTTGRKNVKRFENGFEIETTAIGQADGKLAKVCPW